MSAIKNHLAIVADYVERSTHWQEGGADRHSAKESLSALQDKVDWLEKGLAEWRELALSNDRQARAARSTARIAISHLQASLNRKRTPEEQQTSANAAREWLESIGSNPL